MAIKQSETNFPGSPGQVCLPMDAMSLLMQEADRLRELETECRRRALAEPQKRWHWLAQAAKYHIQADRQIVFEDGDSTEVPEVGLLLWPVGRDERRQFSCATREQLDGFYRPEDRRPDCRVTAC
jgi:hypothetical protein